MEFVNTAISWQPCTDLRQILFGPDSAHRALLVEARKLLGETDGEKMLIDMAARTLDVPMSEALGAEYFAPAATLPIRLFVKSVDVMTGSKRMQACIGPIIAR